MKIENNTIKPSCLWGKRYGGGGFKLYFCFWTCFITIFCFVFSFFTFGGGLGFVGEGGSEGGMGGLVVVFLGGEGV